jgi:1-aminocyclopropane-1-carboxylate deaminase
MDNGWNNIISPESAVIERVHLTYLSQKDIALDVLRLDKLHPVVSGNKYFKLKYYLQEAREQQKSTLVTFGGAYSNHIVATAFAAHHFKLKSIGIIRGEEPPVLSHTLRAAMAYGMALNFISRQAYKAKSTGAVSSNPGNYLVPEGGEGLPGIKGAAEILELVKKETYTHIICAIGTATMFRGICQSALPQHAVIGIPVLKGFESRHLEGEISTAIHSKEVVIFNQYHWGGYAKTRPELFAFMNDWYRQTQIPTDFVYTGKLLYAVVSLLLEGYFEAGSRLLVIHSGGLQGNQSLSPQTLDY